MHARSLAVRVALVGALGLTACGTSAAGNPTTSGGRTVLDVVASINAWGSILAQLGGVHVHEHSIITNPDTDPHSYEPTPADARTIADSQLFVDNGIGYDPWAAQAVRASPDVKRVVLTVGTLVHVPDGGNPHRWYAPADVERVADQITADLRRLDPADHAYFAARHQAFEGTDLARYHQLIGQIKARYAGVPVGASESIFAPLADALGLDLVTPAGFLKAISEGTDPSAADKATIDTQIAQRQLKVYVYNSQNSTPDVAAQVSAAKAQGIPVVAVTETLSPASASFEQWQVAQLVALAAALHEATGK
ncbi:zinc ABC transporter substrate-binding protein [Jatrophihabitans sp.]|uniref:metal ABC transporter solute-binding protein, Zn/Mn family n=1 Tax=Jatrophihabitans sp. TaxID=1932789 RepID=UPI0030C73548|nr:ABC-type metal ion transport system, periplasmic component/surface adhesin [Jatrophihabitans sp.]